MKPKATRQAFGEALAELGEKNQKVVVLDADLSKSTKSEIFAKKFPNRFFEMGIAEANMIGTGAGLALSGFVPFVCSFGCFVTGRYDTIRMSVAYARANVKIVGTHAGLGIGDDGHSQMGLEDLSLMRGLPEMVVLQPCDEIETKQMVEFLGQYHGPAYLRLTRQALAPVHDSNYHWSLGKVDVLKKGSHTLLLATGAAVQECLLAYYTLRNQGKTCPTVVNVPCLKPLESAELLFFFQSHKKIITVEDHYTTGGLGSALAEILAESGLDRPLKRLGVCEKFGESGDPLELYEKFGFSASKIVEALTF